MIAILKQNDHATMLAELGEMCDYSAQQHEWDFLAESEVLLAQLREMMAANPNFIEDYQRFLEGVERN